MYQKIIIQEIDKPKNNKIKEDVKWICKSLGLTSGRDTENISFKVMCGLLEMFSETRLVSTEDLAKSLRLEPSRINHHVRCLMGSGIIFREKRKIALRGGSLSSAIEEMKRDSEQMFNRLLEVSREIDKKLKLD